MDTKKRNSYLTKTYGITLDQYNQMLADQNDSCALCNKHKSNFKRALHVDHNHKTGKVRGLLCFYCNKRRVGQNDKESATKLKEYMDKYE